MPRHPQISNFLRTHKAGHDQQLLSSRSLLILCHSGSILHSTGPLHVGFPDFHPVPSAGPSPDVPYRPRLLSPEDWAGTPPAVPWRDPCRSVESWLRDAPFLRCISYSSLITFLCTDRGTSIALPTGLARCGTWRGSSRDSMRAVKPRASLRRRRHVLSTLTRSGPISFPLCALCSFVSSVSPANKAERNLDPKRTRILQDKPKGKLFCLRPTLSRNDSP